MTLPSTFSPFFKKRTKLGYIALFTPLSSKHTTLMIYKFEKGKRHFVFQHRQIKNSFTYTLFHSFTHAYTFLHWWP